LEHAYRRGYQIPEDQAEHDGNDEQEGEDVYGYSYALLFDAFIKDLEREIGFYDSEHPLIFSDAHGRFEV